MDFALSELTCLFFSLGLETTTCKLPSLNLSFLFSALEFLPSLLKSGHSGRARSNQLDFGLTLIFSLFFLLLSNFPTEGNNYFKISLRVFISGVH